MSNGRAIVLVMILLVAAGLRFWDLGQLSFWYDEVVTLRVARQPTPRALFQELSRIDATRAPLHPLLLHAWVAVFGPGEASARALSALCGVAVVLAMAWIGRIAANATTALWSAWLGAVSPLLVQYSREARMYSWLVLATCCAWGILLTFRSRSGWRLELAYAVSLVLLAYSHPLGLLLIGALGLAYWCERDAYQWPAQRWVAVHAVVALAVAPWVGRYFDHEPELVTGKLPLRFLLGFPIGFTGGNRWVLILSLALIVLGWGGLRVRTAIRQSGPAHSTLVAFQTWLPARSATPLLCWFLVPPVLLYLYSRIGRPIYGPSRYTLFVGPAYLILIAGGLARLPRRVSYAIALCLAVLSWQLMTRSVFAPDLKADWRDAATDLKSRPNVVPLVVASDNAGPNFEVETARYYLGENFPLFAAETVWVRSRQFRDPLPNQVWFAVGLRGGEPVAHLPQIAERKWTAKSVVNYPGLRLTYLERSGSDADPRSGLRGPP